MRYSNMFGECEAENDEMLSDVFVKLERYDHLIREDKLFIIGEKGGGRSALLRHLKETSGDRYLIKVEIYGDDLDYGQISKQFVIDDKIAGPASRKHLYYFWQFTIYTAMMLALCEKKDELDFQDTRHIKEIERHLEASSIEQGTSIKGFLSDLVINIEKSFWKKKLDSDISIISAIKRYILCDQTFERAVNALKEVMNESDDSFMILFDRIDRWFGQFYYKDTNSNEQYILYDLIESLLYCVHDIKHTFKEKAYIKAFIPKDKYIPISSRDMVKLNPHSIDLCWRKRELQEFAARRIALTEGTKIRDYKSSDFDLYWNRIFEEKVSISVFNIPEDSFSYILRHTFYRPRDLQLICNKIIENMRGRKATADEIKKYTHIACDEMANIYFQNEYKTTYWYVENLINVFKGEGLTNVYKYDEFYERVQQLCKYSGLDPMNIPRMMEELYRMNFVGMVHVTDNESTIPGMKKRYNGKWYICSFFFACPHNSIEKTAKNDWIVLHPVFTDGFRIEHDREIPIL